MIEKGDKLASLALHRVEKKRSKFTIFRQLMRRTERKVARVCGASKPSRVPVEGKNLTGPRLKNFTMPKLAESKEKIEQATNML